MKEKIKKIILGYLPGFITGLIICGGISVIAATYFPSNDVTYDNSASGLVSTDVQGAIDELYGVCFPSVGDQVIEDAGLEKDPYECRYFFVGANPNNYITFNGEKAGWRIISVECDGTIKIMRTLSIGNQYWDTGGSNNWARPASLNIYLNSTYYSELGDEAQNQIVTKDFSIGSVTYENNDLVEQVIDENSKKWQGKIALITASEYIRTNSNKSDCETLGLNNSNYNSCKNTTWMCINDDWWTLSAVSNSDASFNMLSNGLIYNSIVYSARYSIIPVLYLSSDIKITGGDGSQSNPYEISL